MGTLTRKFTQTIRRVGAGTAALVAGAAALAPAHAAAYGKYSSQGRPLAAVSQSVGNIQVFWSDANGKLDEMQEINGNWSAAVQTPVSGMATPPTAVTTGGKDYVFYQGVNGHLWEAVDSSGTWSAPADLGMGQLGSEPTADTWSPFTGVTQIDVFWQGTDNDLWQAEWLSSTGSWTGPSNHGEGPLNSAPAAQYANHEVLDYWVNTDNGIEQADYDAAASPPGWSSPDNVKMGPLGSAPTPADLTTGQYLFWKSTGTSLYYAYYAGGWHGPTNSNLGPVDSAPTAVALSDSDADVFWQTGGDLWQAAYDNGTWTAAQSVGSLAATAPASSTGTSPAPATATELTVSPRLKVLSRKCSTRRVKLKRRTVTRRSCHTTTAPGRPGTATSRPDRPATVHALLRTSAGKRLARAAVSVSEQVSGHGSRTLRPITTNASGQFTAKLSGPSGTYRFSYAGAGGNGASEAVQRVNATAATTIALPKRITAPGSFKATGAIKGGYVPRQGLLLQLYYRVRGHSGGWSPFGPQLRSDSRGRWHERVPVSVGAGGYTYQFQARVRAQSVWPFTGATSATVTRRIR